MILYNTLMGFCAGLILLMTVRVVAGLEINRTISRAEGMAFIVVGLPLMVLSGAMALTWPLTVNPPINIVFGEPSLMLGLLAVVGGLIAVGGQHINLDESWFPRIIGALGLMLTAISAAIFRFNLVGDAPSIEPITGQFHGWENTTFGAVYLIAAIGCLAAPFIRYPAARRISVWAWRITGVFFLLFSVLNYYTHIGLLTCSGTGNCHSF